MSAYKKRVIEINNGKSLSQKEKVDNLTYLINQRIKTLEKANIRDWKKFKKENYIENG